MRFLAWILFATRKVPTQRIHILSIRSRFLWSSLKSRRRRTAASAPWTAHCGGRGRRKTESFSELLTVWICSAAHVLQQRGSSVHALGHMHGKHRSWGGQGKPYLEALSVFPRSWPWEWASHRYSGWSEVPSPLLFPSLHWVRRRCHHSRLSPGVVCLRLGCPCWESSIWAKPLAAGASSPTRPTRSFAGSHSAPRRWLGVAACPVRSPADTCPCEVLLPAGWSVPAYA